MKRKEKKISCEMCYPQYIYFYCNMFVFTQIIMKTWSLIYIKGSFP